MHAITYGSPIQPCTHDDWFQLGVVRMWIGDRLVWTAEGGIEPKPKAVNVKPALAGLTDTAPDARYRGIGFCD